MSASTRQRADILAFNSDDRPILTAEVKAHGLAGSAAVREVEQSLRDSPDLIPYAMLVDSEWIEVYAWNGHTLSGPLCRLATGAILSSYDPAFGAGEVLEFYFIRLVDSWLRDLAYHWKSEAPPGLDELSAIGLAQQLAGGDTLSEPRLVV
jgi:hypothetical protein